MGSRFFAPGTFSPCSIGTGDEAGHYLSLFGTNRFRSSFAIFSILKAAPPTGRARPTAAIATSVQSPIPWATLIRALPRKYASEIDETGGWTRGPSGAPEMNLAGVVAVRKP